MRLCNCVILRLCACVYMCVLLCLCGDAKASCRTEYTWIDNKAKLHGDGPKTLEGILKDPPIDPVILCIVDMGKPALV